MIFFSYTLLPRLFAFIVPSLFFASGSLLMILFSLFLFDALQIFCNGQPSSSLLLSHLAPPSPWLLLPKLPNRCRLPPLGRCHGCPAPLPSSPPRGGEDTQPRTAFLWDLQAISKTSSLLSSDFRRLFLLKESLVSQGFWSVRFWGIKLKPWLRLQTALPARLQVP